MKIICNSYFAQDVQILTKDGIDIVDELNIISIKIELKHDEVTQAIIRCIPDSIELDKVENLLLDDDSDQLYQITPITKIKKGE